MAKRRTQHRAGSGKTELLQVRLSDLERQAFKDAADLAGIGLSTWVRERLRLVAIRELENAGRRIAFLADKPTE